MRAPAGARRWLPFAISGTAGFLIAFLAVAALLLPGGSGESAQVTVPSVMGLAYPDAERRLAAAGLRATLGRERPAPDAPKNTVLGQKPAAGETVDRGAEVVLDVSEGVERATIPALTGLTRDDAERTLRDVGLVIGDVTEVPSDTARGIVVATAPAVGYTVPRGSRVALTVSAGPTEVSLPDVVGRELTAARGLLEQLGLAVAPIEFDTLSTLPPGTVIAQTPAAGSAVPGGSTVTLRIAGRP